VRAYAVRSPKGAPLPRSGALSEEQWLDALAKNPILIERPIVVKSSKAVIGRPPENVLTLLTSP